MNLFAQSDNAVDLLFLHDARACVRPSAELLADIDIERGDSSQLKSIDSPNIQIPLRDDDCYVSLPLRQFSFDDSAVVVVVEPRRRRCRRRPANV